MELNKKIPIKHLLFDIENPRFLSDSLTQDKVYQYLLDFERVEDLAKNIEKKGFIQFGERLICLQKGDSYIVLEGNRRLAACKFLNMKKEDWIASLIGDVVDNREDADYMISSRHIDGIKKWPPITKKYFYAKKFLNGKSVEEITEFSPESTTKIKNHIRGYLFIENFYKINKNSLPEKEKMLEKIDVDILDSRILQRLKASLNLEFDDRTLKIKFPSKEKEAIFQEILLLIGNALWTNKNLNTRTINQNDDWKKMLNEDVIIPGLNQKINEYINQNITGKDLNRNNANYNHQNVLKDPNKRNKLLTVNQQNDLKGISEINDKVCAILFELNELYLNKTPISISFLIRALCDHSVQLYDEHFGKKIYNKNNLCQSMQSLKGALYNKNLINQSVATNVQSILTKNNMLIILNGTIHDFNVKTSSENLHEYYDALHPLFKSLFVKINEVLNNNKEEVV